MNRESLWDSNWYFYVFFLQLLVFSVVGFDGKESFGQRLPGRGEVKNDRPRRTTYQASS